MHRRTLVLAIIAVLAVAGCAGNASPAATAAAPAAPTAVAPTAAVAVGTAVSIVDFAFNAADVTVKAGTTVTWTNTGQAPHTVTSTDKGFASSETLNSGATYAVTFPTAGTFSYVCAIHRKMKGTVTVTP